MGCSASKQDVSLQLKHVHIACGDALTLRERGCTVCWTLQRGGRDHGIVQVSHSSKPLTTLCQPDEHSMRRAGGVNGASAAGVYVGAPALGGDAGASAGTGHGGGHGVSCDTGGGGGGGGFSGGGGGGDGGGGGGGGGI